MKNAQTLTSLFATVCLTLSVHIAVAQTASAQQLQRDRVAQPASRPPVSPTVNQLAAPGEGGTGIVTTCTGVSSCNDFIALCVASGGDFTPIAHDEKGRPSAGECDN